MTYITKVVIIISMKNILSLFLGLFISINASAFMSGISPEKDGGPKLEIIKGVIYKGTPNRQVTVVYGIIKNKENIEIITPRIEKISLNFWKVQKEFLS